MPVCPSRISLEVESSRSAFGDKKSRTEHKIKNNLVKNHYQNNRFNFTSEEDLLLTSVVLASASVRYFVNLECEDCAAILKT